MKPERRRLIYFFLNENRITCIAEWPTQLAGSFQKKKKEKGGVRKVSPQNIEESKCHSVWLFWGALGKLWVYSGDNNC